MARDGKQVARPPNSNVGLDLCHSDDDSGESVSSPAAAEQPQQMYVCNYCNRRFVTFQALGGHQNAHRTERGQSRTAAFRASLMGSRAAGELRDDGHHPIKQEPITWPQLSPAQGTGTAPLWLLRGGPSHPPVSNEDAAIGGRVAEVPGGRATTRDLLALFDESAASSRRHNHADRPGNDQEESEKLDLSLNLSKRRRS